MNALCRPIMAGNQHEVADKRKTPFLLKNRTRLKSSNSSGVRSPFVHAAISLIALVRCGSTSGSLSMAKQDMGPCRLYVSKNRIKASLRCPLRRVSSSSRMTVSGDKRPCAVGKEGSVSQLANTELESFMPEPDLRC